MTFEEFIRSLRPRHFAPSELLIGLERGNTEPPPELWHNVALPLAIWDRTRSHFRRPVTLLSAHRSHWYNRHLPQPDGTTKRGAEFSQHRVFGALDGRVSGVPPAEVAAYLREQRGMLFEIPIRIERVGRLAIPFAEIETYDRRGGGGCLMRWKGGIGVYSWGNHVDARGSNAGWSA